MSEEQRDPEPGPLSSAVASEADEEASDEEPVRNTEAGPMPFTNYAPNLMGLVRSASVAATSLARRYSGARGRTAASSHETRQRSRPSTNRASDSSGASRPTTPRRRLRSDDEEASGKLGTPSRRRLRSKTPATPQEPVGELPEFPISGSAASASGFKEGFFKGFG